MKKYIRNSLVVGLLALFLMGCVSRSVTKSGITANSALLKPAASEVAKNKDSCEAQTTTPGWFGSVFGFGQTVTTKVSCE
jgi:hypothetical protein